MWACSSRLALRRSTLGEPPGGAHRGPHDRDADPQQAQHRADQQAAADDQQVQQAQRQPDRHERQAARAQPQPPPQVQLTAHGPPCTSTAPRVLSAWIRNGASSVAVSPRTRRRPVSRGGVDPVAARRDDARTSPSVERSSIRSGEQSVLARTSPTRERALRRKPQNAVHRDVPAVGHESADARSAPTRTAPVLVRTVTGTLSGTATR